MPDELWSGPRRKNWARACIPPRGNWWRPVNGCMRREWRPLYDPLPRPPRRSRFAHAIWRVHPDIPFVPGCARRFSERDEGELADLSGDDRQTARPIWARSTYASALLAVAEVFRPGGLRLFIRV